MTSGLVGAEVELLVSDPWEFGTKHGVGPFAATVLLVREEEAQEQALLLRLAAPLIYQGVQCEYLVASPRHEGEGLASFHSGQILPCNLTVIPEDRATGPDPFDLAWWRGGVGLIGSLRKLAPAK